MSILKTSIFLCLISLFLSACGSDGFSNNQGPKKPTGASQSSERLFN